MGQRIYYANQVVEINGPSGTGSVTNATWDLVNGVQSVGVTTNYNREPVFQLGQDAIYENFADIPDVEVTINKVLDGSAPLYVLCMGTGSLSSVADHKCGVRIHYFDTNQQAGSTALNTATIVPAYLDSVTYTFPSEGYLTEEVTLVGNSKSVAAGNSTTAHSDTAPPKRVFNRSNISSINAPADGEIQNMTITLNLNREDIFKLGQNLPFSKYVNFPVEVTTEITSVAQAGSDGDASTTRSCTLPADTTHTIEVTLCDGMNINLGPSNVAQSVSYAGGGGDGGNLEATVTYLTYNAFTITAPTAVASAYPSYVEDDQTFPIT